MFLFETMFKKKGFELGDEQVKCWLVSLIVTILTGILITQPLQVTPNKNKLTFCNLFPLKISFKGVFNVNFLYILAPEI